MSSKLGEGADHLSALLEASLKENGDENRKGDFGPPTKVGVAGLFF